MHLNKLILNEMFHEMTHASSLYRPSTHWQYLNKVHLEQLKEGDINNFKRSVNMKYFNWSILGILAHQFKPVLNEIKKGNFSIFLKTRFRGYNANLGRKVTEYDFISAQVYKVFVASLFNFVKSYDKLSIFDKIQEPTIGNPFMIKYKDKVITQDLCNSILELYSSLEALDTIDKNTKIDIAEIGAGYGRLAHVFLKAFPNSTYCIIDIPIALYLAQEYLSKVLPKEKIFYYRPFKSYKDIKKEFEESRIRFIMAHQIEFLPKRIFDQVINVSSLHEMKRVQIKNYIKQINRLCKGYFYQKQWRKSRVKDNNYIRENEYPIPKKWKTLYHRKHPIQNWFFEALYKVR